jgi:hypothetical protein
MSFVVLSMFCFRRSDTSSSSQSKSESPDESRAQPNLRDRNSGSDLESARIQACLARTRTCGDQAGPCGLKLSAGRGLRGLDTCRDSCPWQSNMLGLRLQLDDRPAFGTISRLGSPPQAPVRPSGLTPSPRTRPRGLESPLDASNSAQG